MKALIAALSTICLVGCVGQIYTMENPEADSQGRIKGVLFYGYQPTIETTTLDRIRHEKTGDITHSAYAAIGSKEYCASVDVKKTIYTADYSKRYAVYYDAAPFEMGKFGVTLDKGMLAGVNAEFTPAPKTITDIASDVVSIRSEVLNPAGKKTQKIAGQQGVPSEPKQEQAEESQYLKCSHSK